MPNIRIERINDEIQKIIAKVISFEVEDPVIRDQIVQVVDVNTSSDLSVAKVFLSILGDDEHQAKVFEALKRARGFIKKRLTEEISLRVMPEIVFVYDESYEKGTKVLEILKTLSEKKDK